MKLIEGTFLQFHAGMREVSAAQWAKELDAMRAAKMRMIILQWTQADGKNLFDPPGPVPGDTGPGTPAGYTVHFRLAA